MRIGVRSIEPRTVSFAWSQYVARAVVFALVGYGLIRAAVDYDPKKAVGLDGALHELAASSYGPALLWLVAMGLAGFGIYSIVDARYHRV